MTMQPEGKTSIGSAHPLHACPMHPEITGKEGDKCSKCGMRLEPVTVEAHVRDPPKDPNNQEHTHCSKCGAPTEPGKGEDHKHGAAQADVKGHEDGKCPKCGAALAPQHAK